MVPELMRAISYCILMGYILKYGVLFSNFEMDFSAQVSE